MDLLGKTEGLHQEEEEAIESLINARLNLQNKCDLLVGKNNDLEEKSHDMHRRYDERTDQMGKLCVKNFVLTAEIRRIKLA